jgi:hypothetical protein
VAEGNEYVSTSGPAGVRSGRRLRSALRLPTRCRSFGQRHRDGERRSPIVLEPRARPHPSQARVGTSARFPVRLPAGSDPNAVACESLDLGANVDGVPATPLVMRRHDSSHTASSNQGKTHTDLQPATVDSLFIANVSAAKARIRTPG